jgi:hypothetical protein
MSNTNSSTSNILDDKLALVSVSIGTFGGYRRATRQMIAELGGSLPDCAAVTEGSIKVFPNKPMKPFGTARRKVFRSIAAVGIKALGSRTVFAIPKTKLPAVEKLLADAHAQHAADVADLDAQYDTLFDQHVAANPAAAAIISGLKVSRATAIAKMHFTHDVFQISPVIREGQDPNQGVQSLVAGLARQVFDEVADAMQKLLESDSLTGKIKAGQRTLRPIKAQVTKMQGLSFLDKAIDDAIQFIGTVLATLPTEGYIEDTVTAKSFSTLLRLVELLSDTDDIVDAAGKTANGLKAEVILFPPKVVAQASAPAPATAAVVTAPSVQPATPAISAPPKVPGPTAVAKSVTVVKPAMPTIRPVPAKLIRTGRGAAAPMLF